uniref:Uncharacterized protein n=1 Tax=Triticum urartu TaxID=4572 RepID=A0A8R7TVL8_TRIUA
MHASASIDPREGAPDLRKAAADQVYYVDGTTTMSTHERKASIDNRCSLTISVSCSHYQRFRGHL